MEEKTSKKKVEDCVWWVRAYQSAYRDTLFHSFNIPLRLRKMYETNLSDR